MLEIKTAHLKLKREEITQLKNLRKKIAFKL